MMLELLWMLLNGIESGSLTLGESRTLASTILANVPEMSCGHPSCRLYWAVEEAAFDEPTTLPAQ